MKIFMRNSTRIILSRRISTVPDADWIIVLGDGIIVEQGSHSELIEKNGAYARLHAIQFKEQPEPADL